MSHEFIPTTMSRHIGDNVFFRPIRSWHSGTYAGERLTHMPDNDDRSGCVREDARGILICRPPYTVTHRLYWRHPDQAKIISAFLSYPNGMGACDEYFWEVYSIEPDGGITRFTGENAEAKMEEVIRHYFAR